jgi:peptidoglycan biosynthesis protein MviN/MurJ (putative lipid II flippase)
MRDRITSILEAVGASMIASACAMMYLPLGIAVGGILLIAFASLAAK